jgi:hypothetical protein
MAIPVGFGGSGGSDANTVVGSSNVVRSSSERASIARADLAMTSGLAVIANLVIAESIAVIANLVMTKSLAVIAD